MFKRAVCLSIFLFLGVVFLIPGKAYLDSSMGAQVDLEVPGSFELKDPNNDRKAEFIKFQLNLKAYRERNLIVTGNLEGIHRGSWVALGTSVIHFNWPAGRDRIELFFAVDQIIKYKIFGPYRVLISLKDDQWELPAQVVGFSPKYNSTDFEKAAELDFGNNSGRISTISQAQRAAETWAHYQGIELGNLKEIHYDYDQWQCDYQTKSGELVRFLVQPRGLVRLFKIRRGIDRKSGIRNQELGIRN